jgi:hypothetical protein|tara:strand:- start:184 stop:432 length:249 start_codon:yes stop_codon:yes gene_type:complete
MANSPLVPTTEYKFSVEGNDLVMRFPINPTTSKSGKSKLLATTNGAKVFTHDGYDIQMNVNCYVPIAIWDAIQAKGNGKKKS